MKALITATAAIVLIATPAAARRESGNPAAGPVWYPGGMLPSPIERFGKGRKGMKRYQRSLFREADLRRYQEDLRVVRPAAAQMEDTRVKCDRMLKAALESGDQAEIEETRDRCKPRPYGPSLK